MIIPVMVCACVLLHAQTQAQATANIAVTPTRVILAGAVRTATIKLLNTGDTAATYRLSLVHLRMTEDGRLLEVTEPLPEERFADDLIRFSPRSVTIEPNSCQVVRLQLRKPANLAAGEYRSHLRFQMVPGDDTVEPELADPENSKKVRVNMRTIYSMSIPIIVRQGDTTTSITLSDIRYSISQPDGKPMLSVCFNRSGNQSAYGDIEINFIPRGGKAVTAGIFRGAAVYCPNTAITRQLPLSCDNALLQEGGRFMVKYTQQPDDGGKLLAEASMEVPAGTEPETVQK